MSKVSETKNIAPSERTEGVDYEDDPILTERRISNKGFTPITWSMYMNYVGSLSELDRIVWTGVATIFKGWKSLTRAILGLPRNSRSDGPFAQYAGLSDVHNKGFSKSDERYIEMHLKFEEHVNRIFEEMKGGAEKVYS